jgi:hypothetical protein
MPSMKRILAGCLLLLGCESPELTAGGMRVRALHDAAEGCRLVATLNDKEGGGLRSFAENRALVDARLRNEAARLGGNAFSVIEEMRGDTDEGQIHFMSGVPGLTTPTSRCTNCVLVKAHVFQCEGRAPAAAPPDPACIPQQAAPRASPPAQEED